MSPIGTGDEPFKKGSWDNLWEKERLCKQIMNPYRHSSEVKLCQLAVMGSSLVKSNGSMSPTHTHSLYGLRSEVSHYSQTEGLTGDTGQQRWDSQWPMGPTVSLQEGQLCTSHSGVQWKSPQHWTEIRDYKHMTKFFQWIQRQLALYIHEDKACNSDIRTNLT